MRCITEIQITKWNESENHNRNQTIQITIHNPEGKSTHLIITPLSHTHTYETYSTWVSFIHFFLCYLIRCFVTIHRNLCLSVQQCVFQLCVCVFISYLIATHNRNYAYSLAIGFRSLRCNPCSPLFRSASTHRIYPSTYRLLMVHSTCAIIKLSIDGSFFF